VETQSLRRWRRVTNEEIERMRELRKQGKTINEIAKIVKRHYTTVCRYLQNEVFCWKYRMWVKGCPIKQSTSNNCLIVNCPLRGEKDEG